MPTMKAGRPASIRTRNFRRHLSDADAAILAHAGDGDMSAGFRNLLDMYWQSINDAKGASIQPLNNGEQDDG